MLIECCFVDDKDDVSLYNAESMAKAIAEMFGVVKETSDERRYNTLDELPIWSRSTIEKLISEGKIANKNNLDLSMDMVRVLVITNR